MMKETDPALIAANHAAQRTLGILRALYDGEPLPEIHATFPVKSQILDVQPYERDWWGTVGNGSYTIRRGGGLVRSAGHAIANQQRKAEAAAAATPAWRPANPGTLWVAVNGVILQDVDGIHRWPWASFTNVVWVSPGVLDVTGNSDSGPIRWRIRSWAVELAFVLWCGSQHPHHPQLRAWAWLPASLRPLNQR